MNGHKDWRYWNVFHWLTNNEELYTRMRRLAQYSATLDDAVRIMLDCLPDSTPDGAAYCADSVRVAMAGEWRGNSD